MSINKGAKNRPTGGVIVSKLNCSVGHHMAYCRLGFPMGLGEQMFAQDPDELEDWGNGIVV